MQRTKVDATLEALAEEHAEDPDRVELLHRARRFKASWIELAEALTRTKRSGRWKDWGYESFEAYDKSELHLRQETIDKLTGSYSFLQRRAPSVLTRDALNGAAQQEIRNERQQNHPFLLSTTSKPRRRSITAAI